MNPFRCIPRNLPRNDRKDTMPRMLLEFPEFIDLIMLKYLLIHNKTDTSDGNGGTQLLAKPRKLQIHFS